MSSHQTLTKRLPRRRKSSGAILLTTDSAHPEDLDQTHPALVGRRSRQQILANAQEA